MFACLTLSTFVRRSKLQDLQPATSNASNAGQEHRNLVARQGRATGCYGTIHRLAALTFSDTMEKCMLVQTMKKVLKNG